MKFLPPWYVDTHPTHMLCFGVGSVEGGNLDFLNIFISYWAFSSPSGPDLDSDPMLKTTKQIIF